jgi:hypothetical protein
MNKIFFKILQQGGLLCVGVCGQVGQALWGRRQLKLGGGGS